MVMEFLANKETFKEPIVLKSDGSEFSLQVTPEVMFLFFFSMLVRNQYDVKLIVQNGELSMTFYRIPTDVQSIETTLTL